MNRTRTLLEQKGKYKLLNAANYKRVSCQWKQSNANMHLLQACDPKNELLLMNSLQLHFLWDCPGHLLVSPVISRRRMELRNSAVAATVGHMTVSVH